MTWWGVRVKEFQVCFISRKVNFWNAKWKRSIQMRFSSFIWISLLLNKKFERTHVNIVEQNFVLSVLPDEFYHPAIIPLDFESPGWIECVLYFDSKKTY